MNEKQLETLKRNNKESRDFVRSCFRFALMIILKDEKDKKVTVTRLCQIAGVSRMGFYRNYHTVDDVLDDQIGVFARTLGGRIGTDVYDNWLALFKSAEEHRADLEVIIDAGFGQEILKVFLSMVPEEEESRTLQTIWVTLYHGLLIKWIKEKYPRKAEDMARLAYKYTKDIPLVVAE